MDRARHGGVVARITAAICTCLLLPLLSISCSDANPAHLVMVEGWMRRMAFSMDGSFLWVSYGHYRGPEDQVVEDSLAIFEVDSWKPLMKYVSAGDAGMAYTCADPDVLIHSEDKEPWGENPYLIIRSISTAEELNRLEIDHIPGKHPESKMNYCDLESNVFYMDILKDKITAVDGSTGEVVREYLAENVGLYAPFVVQKEKDRLVRIDHYEDVVWVYRLSTTELLGKIEMWPWYRTDLWVDYVLPDDDHVLYGLMASRDGRSGIYLILVDLITLEIEQEYYIGNYILDALDVMDPGSSQLVLAMTEPNATCTSLWLFDIETGEKELGLDLCELGWGGAFPAPELDLYLVGDWRHYSGVEQYFYVYTYPEFELMAEGPAPSAYEEVQYLPGRKLMAMESYFNGHFGVFDMVSGELLDDFHVCNELAINSLRIDPSERWAAVMCMGSGPDVIDSVDDHPTGAGFAVVDMERYR